MSIEDIWSKELRPGRVASYEEIKQILNEIDPEIDAELIERGLLTITDDGDKQYALGACHSVWGMQKRILRERYGIDWKTPAEQNPDITFD